jgi:hypothetical protein
MDTGVRSARILGLPLMALIAISGCGEAEFLEVTALASTRDSMGPYWVRAVIAQPDRIDELTLVYRVDRQDDIRVGMVALDNTEGVYEAAIPGQPIESAIEYRVELVTGSTVSTAPQGSSAYRFYVQATPCQSEAECGVGEICDASQRCRTPDFPCQTDSECGRGFRCSDVGSCRLAGRSCTSTEGCLLAERCDIVLGECVPWARCDNQLVCPVGFTCAAETGICREICAGDAECWPGAFCSSGICEPASVCSVDAACGLGQVCDPLLSVCRVAGAGICARCQLDRDCGGPDDHCVLFPEGLRCSKSCEYRGCPQGFQCDRERFVAQCVPSKGVCQ